METTLAAQSRSDFGKGAARKLRQSGRVPAVIYGGGGAATSIAVDPVALQAIFRKTQNRNTLLHLQVEEGKNLPVLVKMVDRHPVSRAIRHIDFYAVSEDKPVDVSVAVRTTGRPEGATLGGRLRIIQRELMVRCRYDRIPASFELDVTSLNIDDMIRASEIETPDGVELLFDHDFNVVTVYGRRVRGSDSEDAEASGEGEGEAEAEAE